MCRKQEGEVDVSGCISKRTEKKIMGLVLAVVLKSVRLQESGGVIGVVWCGWLVAT